MTPTDRVRAALERIKKQANLCRELGMRTDMQFIIDQAENTLRDLETHVLIQGWQPIETAPRDGTRFIAYDGERVFTAFYKENKVHNAVEAEKLQVIFFPGTHNAAGTHFAATLWMPMIAPYVGRGE